MSKVNDRTKGITLVILAAFFFAGMGAFVRLAGDVPSVQKGFFRNAVAVIFSFAVLMKMKEKVSIKKGDLKFLFLRAASGTIGLLCNFYAIDHMALSDASMLNKLSPFFATLLSFFILKERPTKLQISAVVLAFAGSLLVIKPGFESASMFAGMIGLLGGLGAGFAYVMVRLMTKKGVKKQLIVFFFSAFSCLVCAPKLIFDFSPMTVFQLCMLIGAGLCGCGGQYAITNAYSYAPASQISVFDYSQVIFSTLLGGVLFNQLPDMWSFIGYAVIVGVGIVMFVTQHKEA